MIRTLRHLWWWAPGPDLGLVFGVGLMVFVLLLPMPPDLLDVLFAVNIAGSGLLLATVLLVGRGVALSTLPSLLLLSTLFRLVLNVASTRLILSTGSAGGVVQTFGRFVAGSDLVVGAVVFGIITLAQLMVIGKGAERVAEVGARFSLDALPGHQMAIEAGARAGAISEAEAQARRDDLIHESQFFGAMDGAMRFVRGDAIVGLIIVVTNLVAGICTGLFRFGMTVAEAAETFALLTIGDGLAGQIPALLTTLAAALLATRVADARQRGLGARLGQELTARPTVLWAAAAFCAGLALVPGLPRATFAVVGAGLVLAARARQYSLHQARPASGVSAPPAAKLRPAGPAGPARVSGATMVNVVDPLTIEVGASSPIDAAELTTDLIPELRSVLFAELGVRFPAVRVRTNVARLTPGRFAILVHDVPAVDGEVNDRVLVVEAATALRAVGVDAQATTHPWGAGPAALVGREHEPLVEALGHTVWSPAGQVALHLAKVMRRTAARFVGIQETKEMLDRVEAVYPAVVREVTPKIVTVPQLAEILRRLVDERVSIRDLRAILEALVEVGDRTHDPVTRTEWVRAALGAQIAHAYVGRRDQLSAVVLEPALEDLLESAIVRETAGSYLSLEPQGQRVLVASVARIIGPAVAAGTPAVIVTRSEIRRYLRKAIETDLDDIPVLSYQELPPHLTVQPIGRVVLPDDVELAA